MSMSGQRRLEIERERLEQLRLAQVREECLALADACERAGAVPLAVLLLAGLTAELERHDLAGWDPPLAARCLAAAAATSVTSWPWRSPSAWPSPPGHHSLRCGCPRRAR